MIFASDDAWETSIFILVCVKFMGIDLVTEEDRATVKCSGPCKMWETRGRKQHVYVDTGAGTGEQ